MSITSANAIFLLSVATIYVAPQQLQKFAADDIFSTDPVDSAEIQMGVDGKMAAGFVFVPIKQSVSLMADSPSGDIFDNWFAAQQTAKDLYFASGTIILPSLKKKYSLNNGVLTTYPPLPDGGKSLKARKFGITWESFSAAVA